MNGDTGRTGKAAVFILTEEAADEICVLVKVQKERGCRLGEETSVEGVEARVGRRVDAGCGVIASSYLMAHSELDWCMGRDGLRLDETDSMERGFASLGQ